MLINVITYENLEEFLNTIQEDVDKILIDGCYCTDKSIKDLNLNRFSKLHTIRFCNVIFQTMPLLDEKKIKDMRFLNCVLKFPILDLSKYTNLHTFHMFYTNIKIISNLNSSLIKFYMSCLYNLIEYPNIPHSILNLYTHNNPICDLNYGPDVDVELTSDRINRINELRRKHIYKKIYNALLRYRLNKRLNKFMLLEHAARIAL